jgi:hypothetical protein
LATGLGSVNAMNLVNKWTSVSFTATTTALSLSTTPPTSPVTLTHGTPVSFTINVAPKSGSGTPTGDVSLIAQAGTPPSNVTGIGGFKLSSGSSSGTTDMLPGGSYGVTAHYAGDGTYGASDSTPPVSVTVSAEGSQTHVALLTFNPTTGQEISSNATSVVYGSPYLMRVDVTNNSGQDCFSVPYACPTGQVTATDNGHQLDLGTYKLNSQGYTEDQLIQLTAGAHTISASYSGDSSYNTSTSTDAVTITPAPTTTTLTGLPSQTAVGDMVQLSVVVSTQSTGAYPTGTVQLLNNGVPLGSPVSLPGQESRTSSGYATIGLTLFPSLPAGNVSLSAQYSGDSNYVGSTSPVATSTVADFSLSASPATINISAPGQPGTSTISLVPLYGFNSIIYIYVMSGCPTGATCTVSPSSISVAGSSPATATFTVTTTASAGAKAPTPRLRRRPPTLRLPACWPWLLAGLLALATLTSLATARRRAAGLLFPTTLLVVGIWMACGGGGSPPPPPVPAVSLLPTSLTFSPQNTGTTSAPQPVTLVNLGNASLSISGIAIGGANAGDFAQTNNCGSSVLPGANCGFSVTFTPSAGGSRSASLTIADNASGSPQGVNLSGTGVPVPTPPGSYTLSLQANASNDVHTVQILVIVQ